MKIMTVLDLLLDRHVPGLRDLGRCDSLRFS
jgi:hypothetical protein